MCQVSLQVPKPVTTPENCYYVVVARRVDGVHSRPARPRRRRSDGVVHYRNGFASMASRWCRRGAIDATHPWRGLTQKASKLLTPRTNRNCLYLSILVLRLESSNCRGPDGLERLARLPQLVALRLDEVVRLLRVLVEGLLDLVEFTLLRLRVSLSSIDVLL